MRLRTVAWCVIRQVWLLLAFVAGLLVAAGGWFATSGDPVLVEIAWWMVQTAAVGLVGSFVVHETAHVILLRRIAGVTHIAIGQTLWRFSVMPVGSLTAAQTAGVAAAGPLACVTVGALLWSITPISSLAWWYFGHALFLLPVFGDGRCLVTALRAATRTSRVADYLRARRGR